MSRVKSARCEIVPYAGHPGSPGQRIIVKRSQVGHKFWQMGGACLDENTHAVTSASKWCRDYTITHKRCQPNVTHFEYRAEELCGILTSLNLGSRQGHLVRVDLVRHLMTSDRAGETQGK
jgi:hypothetical protein